MTRDVKVRAYVWTAILGCLAVILMASRCSAECLPSAPAVWAAHPGSHATWNIIDDVKCYRVGYGRHHKTAWRNRKTREGMSPASADISRSRRPGSSPDAVIYHFKNPEHAKLYDQFLDWKLGFGAR